MPPPAPPIRRMPALDAVIACASALAAVVAVTGGLTLELGGARVGLHEWVRPAVVAATLLAFRLWRSRATPGAPYDRAAVVHGLARMALAAMSLTSIGYWLIYLTTVCGGSDSYGYVSASQLIRECRLIQPQAIASWLPVVNPLDVTTPAGYVPAADGSGIAPMYPLGFPALMAVMTLAAGAVGPYLVPPLCGVVCLVLVWRLGAAWYGTLAAWLAVALVAWDPLFITYAKQPMSDVPATMWVLLAIWWLRPPCGPPHHAPTPPRPQDLKTSRPQDLKTSRRLLAAGMATGAAFVTRPGGVGALAVVALFALAAREGRLRRLTWFAAGAIPFGLLQAWLQWRLFGSPFVSGYGTVAQLYAGATVWANLGIYADALWRSHTAAWFAGVAAAWLAPRRTPVALATTMLVVSAVPYLLYFQFDHWETLRFLLPAIVLLSVAAAGGLVSAAARVRPRWAAAALATAVALTVAVQSEGFLRRHEVPQLREAEARYPDVAARVERTTPPDAVVMAAQHSGSIRHYAQRLTVRWDVMRPDDIEAAVAAIATRGHDVYVVLEGEEQQRFAQRFADALTRLRRFPHGQVGNVQIWKIEP